MRIENIKGFNTSWVRNKHLRKQLDSWKNTGLIKKNEHEKISPDLPVEFKEYTIFAKIGLFIFSWIALSSMLSIVGSFYFIAFNESVWSMALLSLISAFLLVFVLEKLIIKSKIYRSGPDNVFQYSAISALVLGVVSFLGFESELWVYFLISGIISLFFLIRYGDPMVAAITWFCMISFIFLTVTSSDLGKVIIPFVLMAIGALTYYLIERWQSKDEELYYFTAQKWLKALSLVLLYAGGNYLIVREGNAFLAGFFESVEIPFAWIFWLFTFLTPAAYIILGLVRQNRQMLHIGLLTLLATGFTVRNYYFALPVEQLLSIVGFFVVFLAVFGIWFLKKTKLGLTSEKQGANDHQNAEGILFNEVIQQSMGQNGDTDQTKFGGGSFGGGGAGSEY